MTTARGTVEAYYAALRAGDPLAHFFAEAGASDAPVVKFGISERLVGAEAVREGLRTQTATTADWTVDSEALHLTERECHAWFSDLVRLEWTDTQRGVEHAFDTRWSGTLERHLAGENAADTGGDDWRFVGMHVSTARTF